MELAIYGVAASTFSGLSPSLVFSPRISPNSPKGGILRPSCRDNSNGFSHRARNKLYHGETRNKRKVIRFRIRHCGVNNERVTNSQTQTCTLLLWKPNFGFSRSRKVNVDFGFLMNQIGIKTLTTRSTAINSFKICPRQ